MSAGAPATDWCSQSEAARRLSEGGERVSQQQISRYLDSYAEIPRRAGENGQPTMVDFAALKRHREQNIRVQERVPEKTGSEDDEASALRRRERLAAAEKAELELAKAKDEVISRVAVERAIQSAAAAFRQAHQRTRFARANALEATRDARDKARVLAEQDAEVERAFAQALSTLASPLSEEQEADAAEQQEFEEAANTGRAESAREDGAAPSNS